VEGTGEAEPAVREHERWRRLGAPLDHRDGHAAGVDETLTVRGAGARERHDLLDAVAPGALAEGSRTVRHPGDVRRAVGPAPPVGPGGRSRARRLRVPPGSRSGTPSAGCSPPRRTRLPVNPPRLRVA